MKEANRKVVALFGSYRPRPGEPAYGLAYEIGRLLALSGFDLINGGHDGTMAASAQGARDGGARVVGVTCSPVRKARAIECNPYLHEVIEAPTLLARIEIMMRRSGGYVVMEGGTGTLAELGVVWEHVNKGFIRPRPVVCVGETWRPTIAAVAASHAGAEREVEIVQSAEEVVAVMRQRAIDVSAEDRQAGAEWAAENIGDCHGG